VAKRNPPWERDEVILALDLFLRLGKRMPDPGEPEVVSLSALLNSLPLHTAHADERFRNPNAVALKLANLRALDQPGHGMGRGGHMDRIVWEEFNGREADVQAVAELIRQGLKQPWAQPTSEMDPDGEAEEFAEGRLMWRKHRAYERNPSLSRKKKARALKLHGRLCCEVCGFDFEQVYGPTGAGYVECHHTVPVHQLGDTGTTRLSDLVLVCANCHRMLHRRRPWLTIENLRDVLQTATTEAPATS
jgi:5-methylcytosine-specific restriction protein A